MSTISNALNNWQKRWQNVSTMRQASQSVCELIPPATKDKMVELSVESARYPGEYKPQKVRELGAPITQDYTLGEVRAGTRESVAIQRPEGTIGTYHTHPFGSPLPSAHDTVDAMDKDDKLMCIGATGKPGTRIQCFTPNEPKWTASQYKFRLLYDDIKDFNKKIGMKYKTRGARLLQFLESIGSPTYIQKVQQTAPEKLKEEAVKAEKSAIMAEDAVKIADANVIRTEQAMRLAQVELSKARTGEEINIAEGKLRAKEDESRRALAKIKIEWRLALDARVTADRAAFTVGKLEQGITPSTADSEEAMGYMREASVLEKRRSALVKDITSQLRTLSYPKEWQVFKHGEYVPYFEAFPNMFKRCRIIWEGFEEDLPYEL